jgi:membrane associated rhomboid family serine protease
MSAGAGAGGRVRGRWSAAAVIYLALAVVGLVGTWTFNVIAIVEQRDFLGEWFGSGPSVNSLGVDLAVVAVAAIVFMVAEGRRLRMRGLALYVLLVPFVALAFAFPLFLSARERRLAGERAERASGTPASAGSV